MRNAKMHVRMVDCYSTVDDLLECDGQLKADIFMEAMGRMLDLKSSQAPQSCHCHVSWLREKGKWQRCVRGHQVLEATSELGLNPQKLA